MEEKKLRNENVFESGFIMEKLNCIVDNNIDFIVKQSRARKWQKEMILDVIHRQNAEIERLKTENNKLTEENRVVIHNMNFHRNKKFELQKQVNELENRFENKAHCNMSENCSMVKQAVKDTANKIYQGLCIYKNWCKMKDAILWGNESEELKVLISGIVGVEVE